MDAVMWGRGLGLAGGVEVRQGSRFFRLPLELVVLLIQCREEISGIWAFISEWALHATALV